MSIKKAIIYLIIIGAVGVAIVLIMTAGGKNTPEYTTATIKEGTIIQTVSETGTIKATSEIKLSFLNPGKISKINYQVGDEVGKGDIIAELDYSDLEISKEKAAANIDVNRQSLNKLLAGARSEDIQVAQAGVDQSRSAYESAITELTKTKANINDLVRQAEKTLNDLNDTGPTTVTTYEQAINSAETSLENTKATYQKTVDDLKASSILTMEDVLNEGVVSLDTINRIITDSDGEDYISVKDPTYLDNTKSTYYVGQKLLTTANESLSLAKSINNNATVVSALEDTLSALNKIYESLKYCFNALDNSITTSAFTQADIDAFKSSISAQQTIITTGLNSTNSNKQSIDVAILNYDTKVKTAEDSLSSARAAYKNAIISAENALSTAKFNGDQQIATMEAKVASAQKALQVAQAKLKQTKAPADKHDIALAQAKVRQAEAALRSINKQIENSIITSPIKGIVTKSNYEIGEQVTVGQPAFSVLGDNTFEIKVLISETDIAKLNLEDKVSITLDAYGEDVVFTGKVKFIEPAETEIQDVVYYEVDIGFDPGDKHIKSGMTANVVITTAEKNNVLIAPSRAIIEKNGEGNFIRILSPDRKMIEKPVVVGLRGDEGSVEIISGVSKGEEAVTHVKENK